MFTETYTLRIFPEASPVFSFVPATAQDVDFDTALTEARKRPDCDTWYITRMSDGIIILQFDASGRDAMLWRNYRRSELAAARRAEVEQRLESKIVVEQIALERDIRRARHDVADRSPIQPIDRIWRAMQRNKLYNAIDEAVHS